MSHYKIGWSIEKEVGTTFPQIQDLRSAIDIWDPKNLYFSYRGYIDETVYIPELILHQQAKATDLVSSAILTNYLIISDKLKRILEQHKLTGIQFAPVTVITKDGNLKYWVVNPYEFGYEHIDFENSEVIKAGTGGGSLGTLEIKSDKGFEVAKESITGGSVWIRRLVLKSEISSDLFYIDKSEEGNFFASARLKDSIEASRCTGITFEKK